MTGKMKYFDVSVVFEGVKQYTVAACDEEDAKKIAKGIFENELVSDVETSIYDAKVVVEHEEDVV